MNHMTDVVPLSMHDTLRWLGRIGQWVVFDPPANKMTDTGATEHALWIDSDMIGGHPEAAGNLPTIRMIKGFVQEGRIGSILMFEAVGRLLADGPKVLCPTADEFEAMDNVDCRVKLGDFRSPFPALLVRVPGGVSGRQASATGSHRLLKFVIVRHHRFPDGRTLLTVTVGAGAERSTFFFTKDYEDNLVLSSLKTVPANYVNPQTDLTPEYELACRTAALAALNLALLLATYGARLVGPVDPVAYAKHRKKKDLARFAAGDLTRIAMPQNVVLRHPASYTARPGGPPTGATVATHWRRGFFRAKAGYAAARARGENVPLVFVKPCLVNGDHGPPPTETVYTGLPSPS